jgi:hypothetical protein
MYKILFILQENKNSANCFSLNSYICLIFIAKNKYPVLNNKRLKIFSTQFSLIQKKTMNILRSFSLMALCLFIATSLFSQEGKFTDDDKTFFQKTTPQYNRWLQSVGLFSLMSVEKVSVTKNDMELEMYLLMSTHDVDEAVAQWRALRLEMSKGRRDSTILEKTLFETFTRLMQISEEKGNIQIYVKDANGQYIPCFTVWIWSENGDIKVDSRLNMCKSKPLDVSVTLPPIHTPKGKTSTLNTPLPSGSGSAISSNAVFDKIQRFAREQFEKTACYDRFPKVEVDYAKSKGNVLVFSVTDLCRVVLKDDDKSVWCKTYELLGGQCNDIRRERLIFTFNYETVGNNGFRLTGELQGLFGSGVFKPRVSGYMDMEPDFNDYLTAYTNNFQGRLKAYLEKQ